MSAEHPEDLRELLHANGPEALRKAIENAEEIPSGNSRNSRNADSDQNSRNIGNFGGEDESESGPPPFPIRCLPPCMARMVTETATATLSPESLVAACALGTTSAALGAGIQIPTGGDRRTRGNLFILAIAESGTGKDTAFRPIVEPLKDREAEILAKWHEETRPDLEAELEVAQAVAKKAREAAAVAKDPLEKGQLLDTLKNAKRRTTELERQLAAIPVLVFTEPTREALSEVLSHQCGEAAACLTPESRGVLGVLTGRYTAGKATDEDIYCSAYSGTPHSEMRRSRPSVSLKRPCLTTLWMIQPDKARDLIGNEAMTESGLLPRFLLFDSEADAEDMPETLPSISTATSDHWTRTIRELVHAYRMNDGEAHLVVLADGATAEFRDFDNGTRQARRRRDGGQFSDIAAYVARWAENAWRLALVLHAAEHGARAHSEPLQVETARKAIELQRWFIDRQLSFIGAERRERLRHNVEKLRTLLLNDYEGAANLGELCKRNNYKAETVKRYAEKFPHLLRVEANKPDGPGRPTERLVAL